jgi:peptide/nickel transport system permease protein
VKEPVIFTYDQAKDSVSQAGITFWGRARRQFRHNRIALWSLRFVYILLFIAIFADVLSNEKPLVCKYKGTIHFPVFREYLTDMGLTGSEPVFQQAEWKTLPYDWAVFPLIPYLPQNLDPLNQHGVSPFAKQHVPSLHWKHWLGTDELGRDVCAGMIYGTRIALMVGLVSMGLAFIIGMFFGAVAGYFGDERLQVSRARLFLNLIFGFLSLFYGLGSRSYALHDALAESTGLFLLQLLFSLLIMLSIIALGNLFVPLFKKIPFLNTKVRVPVDLYVSRLIEIMLSIPTVFLIISVAAIVTKPGLFMVMVIIGLTSWTGIARYVRAELLLIRNLDYMEAAKALGYSDFRMLFRHAIPNALSPVLISLAFGIAGAILTESLLSFLGIGVPAQAITWGSMLALAQQSPGSWWLALFPGLAIFLTVTVYNLIGEGLTDATDPRLKK